MNLRTQMLLAGALTLAVPIIGWQSVKQLDESLRQTRVDAQSLKVANARLSLAESDALRDVLVAGHTTPKDTDLYAQQSPYPLFVDGYDDDWQNLAPSEYEFTNGEDSFRVQLASRNGLLHLFAQIKDNQVIYHKHPLPVFDLAEGETIDKQDALVNGDAVELVVQRATGSVEHILFRTVAPGPVTGLRASSTTRGHSAGTELSRFSGVWVSTASGFQLELSMPLPPLASVVGMAFIDRDRQSEVGARWVGNMSPEDMRFLNGKRVALNTTAQWGSLFHASDVANGRLEPWVNRGTRARLFDRQGRLLSDVNALYEKTEQEFEYDPAQRGLFNAILFRIFAYFVSDPEVNGQPFETTDALHLPSEDVDSLAEQDAETKHYVTEERDIVLGTLLPIGGEQTNGFLLFESNEDLASAYSASRVARLFSLLTLVSLLAGLVLLVYASLLSMRIRSLSQLATKAVADDGRVKGLPRSVAKDEIGDLSRNLSALLERSANYTKYLEALSSRLSHELRTPLSVVKTSIENMDRKRLDAETITLMDRASGGADQLGAIIRALVESTRLEQTVQQSQMIPLDLSEWFQGSLERYKQVYPHVEICVAVNHGEKLVLPLVVYAAPELLQQAFDKLVHNAVSFSIDAKVCLLFDSYIQGGQPVARLAVDNNGSQIPIDRQPQLFDPMFSDRVTDDGELHLGLGLYIVRMIAEAHQGQAEVRNTNSGVQVGMVIPCRV